MLSFHTVTKYTYKSNIREDIASYALTNEHLFKTKEEFLKAGVSENEIAPVTITVAVIS